MVHFRGFMDEELHQYGGMMSKALYQAVLGLIERIKELEPEMDITVEDFQECCGSSEELLALLRERGAVVS